MCEPAGGPTRTRTRRFEAYRIEYGLLGSLGIAKGQPFNPDSRLQGILVKAAQIANDQMRVQSFADRRPDRLAWPTPNGSGRLSALKTAPSTLPPTRFSAPPRETLNPGAFCDEIDVDCLQERLAAKTHPRKQQVCSVLVIPDKKQEIQQHGYIPEQNSTAF
jgi:hypothetical protein